MSTSRDLSALLTARGSALMLKNRAETRTFAGLLAAAAAAPLAEFRPAAPCDSTAATGFALAFAMTSTKGPIVWAAPDASYAEDGAPNAEGLAAFGLDPGRLLLARTRNQTDALWATEEALTLKGALVLCSITPAKKPLSLVATRRLLLAAEKNGTRCALLRFDATTPSAAWTRWRIAAAPSRGEARELGAPTFSAFLERHRAGPSGLCWLLTWNGYEHAFTVLGDGAEAEMDGDPSTAAVDRSFEAPRRRAG